MPTHTQSSLPLPLPKSFQPSFALLFFRNMDTKSVTGPLQNPNVTTPAQQPSQASNVILQATPLLQPGQQLGPLQPTSNLGSVQQTGNPAGTYLQPNPQTNYGAVQQPTPQTNIGATWHQPNPLGSLQPSNLLSKLAPNAMHQLIKADRSMPTMSDDNVLVSHILGSHTPDGRDVDVKPLLRLVEEILSRATLTPDALFATV